MMMRNIIKIQLKCVFRVDRTTQSISTSLSSLTSIFTRHLRLGDSDQLAHLAQRLDDVAAADTRVSTALTLRTRDNVYDDGDISVAFDIIAPRFTSILWLELTSCNLTAVPPAFAAYTHLQGLVIGRNAIEVIEDWFCEAFTDLRELYIEENTLTALPPNIHRLRSLTVLVAHHNQLTSLPDAICTLGLLSKLILTANDIVDLPA